MGKRITQVSRKTMEALQRQAWPGNVRELRNVLEHAVIVTAGETLVPPTFDDARPAAAGQTMAESERDHILGVLERTGWRIKGAQGAAEVLGLKRGTLYGRMRKLGIPFPGSRKRES
jgi:transcriptional regulator of acetoin/glycerol metabolism